MMLLPLPDLETTAQAAVDFAPLLDRLAESGFRRRKRLLGAELDHVRARGLEEVVRHAERFVMERLAPAVPANDGRQTPYRGHPAFIAQHATATCCRGCMEIWHAIPKGRALSSSEIAWVVGLIAAWLSRETGLEARPMHVPASRPARAARKPPRRRAHALRLVVADDDEPAPSLVLEERLEDGSVLRRWLQLELFAGP